MSEHDKTCTTYSFNSYLYIDVKREHFSEVLNRPPPDNPPTITPAIEDLDIRIGPITKKEILAAIRSLKNPTFRKCKHSLTAAYDEF